MPTPPILLDEYRNKQYLQINRTDKYLIRKVLGDYSLFYYILSRQLGYTEYKGKFEENKSGEEKLFKLLTNQQKNDLEIISQKLKPIIKSVVEKLK